MRSAITSEGHFFLKSLVAVGCILLASLSAPAWMINEDYQQRDARPATDFHIFLVGDVGGQITGGGQSPVTNPFADPKRTIRKTEIGNTEIKFEGSNTLPQDNNTNRHFGLYGTGAKPKVRYKAWSYATSPFIVPVPKSNFDFLYNPTTETLAITVENISDDVVTFSEVGFLLFNNEQPIEHLSRGTLPPEAFIPLPRLNHEYQIGESDHMVLNSIPSWAHIVTYGTVFFSGASAGNAYNQNGLGTGGEWSQIAVVDQIPEPVSLIFLCGGTVMFLRRRRMRPLGAMVLMVGLLLPVDLFGWTRGNHAGDWTKGQTIKVKVDTPPGDAAQQAAYLEAVNEAIAEWNDAQAAFGGLQLVISTDANPDVHVKWKNNHTSWGSTAPGKNPVDVTIESNDGLNSRGVTRTLKHEFGHVEGLGHSAASALMKADAYSSTPGQAPSAADLNSADPFINPTADDLAGKKEMWGTVADKSASTTTGNASFQGSFWRYQYLLTALTGPGLVDPVTQFTVELPTSISHLIMGSLNIFQIPQGWSLAYLDGYVDPSSKGLLEDGETSPPSLLMFYATSEAYGILPGYEAEFGLFSPFGPAMARTFTNSPSYDSDEGTVPVPVPEPMSLGLVLLAFGWIGRRPRS